MAIKWEVSKYGSAKIASIGLLTLEVYYNSARSKSDTGPAYKFTVNRFTSQRNYTTMEQAEKAMLAFVKRELAKTIAALEE